MSLEIVLVRHGESIGNVARDQAEAGGLDIVEISQRDSDVPLSSLGRDQASALGRWLTAAANRPTTVWTSPYQRARETVELALLAASIDLPVRVDERLRDRELGVLDLLTQRGVRNRFPGEVERRRQLGKLYYRPPGGESWCDVALRLRALLADMRWNSSTERRLIVTHDAVILLFRYVCEQLTEAQLLEVARRGPIMNSSVTRLEFVADNRPWLMNSFNEDAHLARPGRASSP